MTDSTRFAKVLKTPEVIALAFGAMIGWSWVLLTGVWLTAAGTIGTLIAFCVGGLAVTLIGLTYSELAAAMPKAGGEHIYTQRALGSRWSFVCTWALLFSYVNVCMFEAVALPSAVEYLYPDIRLGTLWNVLGSDVDLGFILIGIGATALVTWVNYLGIRTAAILQAVSHRAYCCYRHSLDKRRHCLWRCEQRSALDSHASQRHSYCLDHGAVHADWFRRYPSVC